MKQTVGPTLSGVDKSLLCLVALITFRATGLFFIKTTSGSQIYKKLVALGVRACDLASPACTNYPVN